MEQWWNDADRGEPKYSERKLFRRQFDQHKMGQGFLRVI
jgi:hypothetical protein